MNPCTRAIPARVWPYQTAEGQAIGCFRCYLQPIISQMLPSYRRNPGVGVKSSVQEQRRCWLLPAVLFAASDWLDVL